MSTWRVVRSLPGAPGVLVYLCGNALDGALREALPGFAIAATNDSGYGANSIVDVSAGLKVCGGLTLAKLAGFSAGCQGVRAALLAGLNPEQVFAIDGTSGPWPLLDTAREVLVWRDYVAQGGTLIATATMQRYTQRLPRVIGKQGPFAATSTVLSRAFAWPEAESVQPLSKPAAAYPGVPAVEKHMGNRAHLFIYPGTDCDAKAHAAQLTHVLPDLLARYGSPGRGVGEMLADLGSEVVEWASGVLEALTQSTAELGYPHGYRAAVAELVADARELGTWHPKTSGYAPKVGDLVISARSGEDPTTGGKGHVERVSEVSESSIVTIGGNENNQWVEAPFTFGADFRGYIEVPSWMGERAVDVARAELQAGVKEKAGPLHNVQIQLYHSFTRRKGSPLAGMPGHEKEGVPTLGKSAPDEVAWCASSASWCAYQAAVVGT